MADAISSEEQVEEKIRTRATLSSRRRVVDEEFVRGAEAEPAELPVAPVAFAQFPLVRLDLADEPIEEVAKVVQVDEEPSRMSNEKSDVPQVPQTSSPGTIVSARSARSKRDEQRRAASAQRQRHEELVSNWMPSQRGANVTLTTRIGSQTVEGWFKRTFVRLARMLYRIHTFPTQQVAPEVIGKIDAEVMVAIGRAQTALEQRQVQCEEMLEQLSAQRAFYSKHFELEVIVTTKTAVALHGVYHCADQLMLLVESLDFAGLLTDGQRRKQIGAIHAAIFGLAESIERLHRGLYVRIAKAAAEEKASEPADVEITQGRDT